MEELDKVAVIHDRFFARLVNLIPTDLYTHSESLSGGHIAAKTPAKSRNQQDDSESGEEVDEDDDEDDDEDEDEESNDSDDSEVDESKEKYYKHKKQPMTIEEKKLKSKDNKKRKYSAENATTEELPGDEIIQATKPETKELSAEKMEGLRQRLQERISQMKQSRVSKKAKTEETPNTNNKKNDTKNKLPSTKSLEEDITQSVQALKKVIDDENNLDMELDGSDDFEDDDDDNDEDDDEFAEPISEHADFEFNMSTTVGNGLMPKVSKSKKDGGKVQRLKRMLTDAEHKRQRLKEMVNSKDENLQRKAHAELWNDALASAAGEKTIVVSTTGQISKAELKIKKALKRVEKKKEKSAVAWTQRLQSVEEDKNSRLAKRDENLANKKHRTFKDTENKEGGGGRGGSNGKGQPISKPGGHNNGSLNRHKQQGKDNNNNNHHKGGNNKGHGGGGNNRAGFEGKKSDGKFLNSK